jgi:TRAP-type C4-dicarboxylate transport system substrate-binding protein
MSLTRRQLVTLAGGALAAPAVLRPGRAEAAEVTLKLHHFLPPISAAHSRFLSPWAKKVEAESGGRIKVQIYPSMQLGGAPPQLFDQARDGVVDMVWTLPGYTPGRFRTLEAFELPFVAGRRAITNSLAVQAYTDANPDDELGQVRLICAWAHDHGLIHSRRLVKTLEDLRGLKLRFPTRLAGEALTALGATAIGMPVPQVPESLAQGVIDGAVIPWEVVPSIKVHELTKYHTDIPGSPTFYTATFLLVMNKARYGSLPADLKAVIDANSGTTAARMAGTAWDEASVAGMQAAEKRGNTFYTLTEDEASRWRRATQPVVDRWLAETKQRNLDGERLLAEARALVARHEKA